MKKNWSNLFGNLFSKKMLLILLCSFGFALSNNIKAQDSTQNTKLRFSLITCDAGDDLYTIWGHTAIRVIDSVNHTDFVFNYGSFDFNTPNFIAKFMRGDLMYFISADTYANFLYEYQYYGRDVHEQVLKLTPAERYKWYQALQVNMIGSNRFYLYNFIGDNCTTRIKDGIFKHAPINNYSIGINSYREEVVSAPYKNGLGWVGLGIDLLLGSVADKTPSLNQEAFLPTLLYKKMQLNPHLVTATNHIKYNTKPATKGGYPMNYLIAFLLLYLFVANWNALTTQRIARVLDITLLFVFGIGGALVLYMSQFSLHTACHENYNLIWLHPLYLLAIPVYFISKKWTGYLGWLFFIATTLYMFASHWIPQHSSKSVIAVMVITLFLQIRLIKRGAQSKYES
ncbi:MAG: hypothetical protein RIR55_977 [Bacteroidota bacterium]